MLSCSVATLWRGVPITVDFLFAHGDDGDLPTIKITAVSTDEAGGAQRIEEPNLLAAPLFAAISADDGVMAACDEAAREKEDALEAGAAP